jgi:antitoxin component YwqK of YwqJK toxin-antitoxin module
LNEAWVLSRETVVAPAVVKMRAGSVKKYQENHPDGTPRVTWSAGTGEDGRYLLEGLQVFYYAGGRKQWETTFTAGRRAGVETYWRPSGDKAWERLHRGDGTWTWKVWNEHGGLAAVSEWRGPELVKYELLGEKRPEK